MIHEFAEGIITYTLFLKGGVKENRSMFYAGLVAGLSTPLGTFAAYPLVNHLKESHLGLMRGIVAGVLIYNAASHLLPEARGGGKKKYLFFISQNAFAHVVHGKGILSP